MEKTNTMQPVIGVTMCIDEDDHVTQNIVYNRVRREYGVALRQAGAQPIFLDATIDSLVAAQLCDGIVISGGKDIDATLYGQEKHGSRPKEPRERTDWERQLIAACDEWEVPILGVCYGQQLLNVHYGGTLYQDIAEDYGSTLDHGSSAAPARHTVTLEKDFLGYGRGRQVAVTGRHHQAVNQLAPGFQVMARAEDGSIEAIRGKGHYGIQWHAEVDMSGDTIYGAFVRACIVKKRSVVARRRVLRSRILTDFFSLIVSRK